MTKAIVSLLIESIIKLISLVSCKLSFNARQRLGKWLGLIAYSLVKSRRDITLNNIRNAYPDQSEDWCEQIARDSYRNLGITYLEALAQKSFSLDMVKSYIKYENIELIEKTLGREHGVILLSAHYGNWELLAYSAGLLAKIPILIIVAPQKHGNKPLNDSRVAGGNKVVSKDMAARNIITALRCRSAIAILADQSGSKDKDVFVDFFGRPVATYKSPAELALRYDVPVIMGFCVRQADGTYRVSLEQLHYDDLQNDNEGIVELTRRHVAKTEEAIRRHPDHWAWQHNRWKHSSPVSKLQLHEETS